MWTQLNKEDWMNSAVESWMVDQRYVMGCGGRRTTGRVRTGMTVTSETIMLLGLILIAMALLPSVLNIIGSEGEGVVEGYQDRIAEDITVTATKLAHQRNDYIAITYEPPAAQYVLTVENNTQLTVTVPGGDTYTAAVTEVLLEDTRIENAEELCITKNSSTDAITIEEGTCPVPTFEERESQIDVSGDDPDDETGTDPDQTAVTVVESGTENVLGTVTADIADTGDERYTGLSETASMPENEGMLFVYDTVDNRQFVMRDMSFGIDIVFADADGTITNIAHAEAPDSGETGEEPHHRYSGTAQYVLEVNYDWTTDRGITEGDRLDFTLP